MIDFEFMLREWSHTAISMIRRLPQDTLEEGEIEALKVGSLLTKGASRSEIDSLGRRLGKHLPAELCEVLAVSDGFVIPVLGTGPGRFRGVSSIGYYKILEPQSYEDWTMMIDRVGSDDYAAPESGDENRLIDMPRREHLDRAIALTTQRGGDIFLAYSWGPEVWECMKLSAHAHTVLYGSVGTMIDALLRKSLESLRAQLEDL